MLAASAARLSRHAKPSSRLHEILQQEAADAGLGDRLLQRLIGVAAPGQGGRIDPPQRLDVAGEAVAVGDRRDVDRDQALDQGGAGQREAHRDLAAEAVADHAGPAELVAQDERGDVVRHRVERHQVGPGRAAVVAQVEREHARALAQPLRDRAPIARRAEQPVQDHQRRAAVAIGVVSELQRQLAVHRMRPLPTRCPLCPAGRRDQAAPDYRRTNRPHPLSPRARLG